MPWLITSGAQADAAWLSADALHPSPDGYEAMGQRYFDLEFSGEGRLKGLGEGAPPAPAAAAAAAAAAGSTTTTTTTTTEGGSTTTVTTTTTSA